MLIPDRLRCFQRDRKIELLSDSMPFLHMHDAVNAKVMASEPSLLYLPKPFIAFHKDAYAKSTRMRVRTEVLSVAAGSSGGTSKKSTVS